MKNACIVIIIFLIGSTVFMRKIEEPEWSKIDTCLERGYCWDHIRHRCEEFDQGYCVKNEQDCEDRNGAWSSAKQYCEILEE